MMETRVEPAPGETATRLDALRARLVPPMPPASFWGWAGPLLVTAFGTYLRFDLSPFGWRFAAALVGSLSILLLARIARRMTRSTLLGCFAGLLLALDGLEFVMSRTALLDIFVMFWVLAAFGCLVVDRDAYRTRLADAA